MTQKKSLKLICSMILFASILNTSAFAMEDVEYDYYEYETPQGYSQLRRAPKTGDSKENLDDMSEEAKEALAKGLGISVEELSKTRKMEEGDIQEVDDISIPSIKYDLY